MASLDAFDQAELEEQLDDPDADLEDDIQEISGPLNVETHHRDPFSATQPMRDQPAPSALPSTQPDVERFAHNLSAPPVPPPSDQHRVDVEKPPSKTGADDFVEDPEVVVVSGQGSGTVAVKPKAFRWRKIELKEMIPFLPQYKVAAAENKIEEFMTLFTTHYFTIFPEQNIEAPHYEKTRTLKGRISKTRPPGVEKPRRDVSTVL